MKSLTIGTPAFNEEASIERVVGEFLEKIPQVSDDFEILLVNDGSTDATGHKMDQLRRKDSRIRVIHHPYNLGFRGIAHTLVLNARKELFAGVSADGEVDIDGLRAMMEKIEDGYDIVVGRRPEKPNYNNFRKFVSSSYNRLVRMGFGVDLKDPGWLKLFKTSILHEVNIISKGAFINAERLLKAHRLGYRIGSVDIAQRPRLGGRASGAKLKFVARAFFDLCCVYAEVKIAKKDLRRPSMRAKERAHGET